MESTLCPGSGSAWSAWEERRELVWVRRLGAEPDWSACWGNRVLPLLLTLRRGEPCNTQTQAPDTHGVPLCTYSSVLSITDSPGSSGV